MSGPSRRPPRAGRSRSRREDGALGTEVYGPDSHVTTNDGSPGARCSSEAADGPGTAGRGQRCLLTSPSPWKNNLKTHFAFTWQDAVWGYLIFL